MRLGWPISRISWAPEKVRIVAFADVVGKVAEKVTKEHDIPMAFDNYDELLALEEVEAVSICTPPVAHRDATIAAPCTVLR